MKTKLLLLGFLIAVQSSLYSYSTDDLATTAIPDINFELALIDLGIDSDGTVNGQVLTSDINTITSLDLSDPLNNTNFPNVTGKISDLTGIEGFVALETLSINDNLVSSIDLSFNTSLHTFTCVNNALTSLDISSNLLLKTLFLDNNQVSILNVNANTLLETLSFTLNNVSILNVNNNGVLKYLAFGRNQINTLDVSLNTNLETLLCDNNGLTSIDVSSNPNLINLGIQNNQISSLDVSTNTALVQLYCSFNQLTSLNIANGNNVNFTFFQSQNNPNLTCITADAATPATGYTTNWYKDVTHMFSANCFSLSCTADTNTTIQNTTLTVSATNGLLANDTGGTLSVIDFVVNGTTISAGNTANLSEGDITINGDGSYTFIPATNYSGVVPQISYALTDGTSTVRCTLDITTNAPSSLTYVPDTAFENYLETHDASGNLVSLGDSSSMGNGVANDTKVYTHRIDTVTSLDVSNIGLSILTGLEDFRDLEIFGAFGGNPGLITADFSNNTKLKRITFSLNSNATSIIFGNLPDVEYVQLGYNNISNVDISGLPNLEEFKEFDGKFNSLNTSGNPNLKILSIIGSDVNSLDLSANTNLETLNIVSSQLINLNLNSNLNLVNLDVSNNSITSLDLSKNKKIETLNLSNNQLASLNLKNSFNTLINTVVNPLAFNITNNSNLTCVLVDSVAYSDANWISKDPQHVYNTSCSSQSITLIPDPNFEQRLIALNIDTDGVLNGQVFTADISSLTNLSIVAAGITNLTGIEDFVSLTSLSVSFNQLTNIDLSNNINLTSLGANDNQLATIDISPNINLKTLNLEENSIVNLDLSQNLDLEDLLLDNNNIKNLDLRKNSKLKFIRLYNNNLESLDIRNGNNTMISTYSTKLNANLNCVAVDNVNHFNTNFNVGTIWKDTHTSFNTDCSSVWSVMTNPTTTTALLAVSGLDVDNDGKITVAEAAAFTGNANGELNLSGTGITDVEGLAAFTSILKLDVSGNGITDLSPLTGSSFNTIAKSTGKTKIVQKTTTMALQTLIASNNNFDVLDISSLSKLTTVDVSSNPNLVTLNMQNGNNANITSFNASNTPNLSCILVDDVNASYLSSWIKDVKSEFVADATDCRSKVLSLENIDLDTNIVFYPNPVNDILSIKLSEGLNLQEVKVYSLSGKNVMKSNKSTLDFSRLSKGFYLVKIITDKGVSGKRIIKN
ncbi:T9SS type A sorting domain-containing protein [Polaribacter sp. OB-PA-B3]